MPDVTDAVLIDGASKAFGEAVVLDDLHLRVPAGSILGLIGPSGAGKTTTVRLLTGALAPDFGGGPGARRGAHRLPTARRASGSATCPSSSCCTRISPSARTSTSSRACSACSSCDARRRTRDVLSSSTCGTYADAGRRTCRAGCSAVSSSPAPSSTTRRSCSSTSRRPVSTPCSAASSGMSCTGFARPAARCS